MTTVERVRIEEEEIEETISYKEERVRVYEHRAKGIRRDEERNARMWS